MQTPVEGVRPGQPAPGAVVGLSVIAQAGTPIAQDGERVWTTPYDDAVLVMPGTRNLKPGGTAVRLGRFAHA